MFLSHLAVCSTGAHAHMPMSALLSTVSGFNKWKNKNRRLNHPPIRASGSERIHWQGDGILSLPPLFWCPLEISPFPFKPYSQLTPVSLLVLCPEAITMAIWVLAGVGPSDVTKGPTLLGPHSPGARADQHTGAISSWLTMWSLKSFLCFTMDVTCVYALMFPSLRDKAEEIKGKMLCGGHFLILQNLQEHAWDWLEITLLWLFFIVLMYVTVKLAGQSGESQV